MIKIRRLRVHNIGDKTIGQIFYNMAMSAKSEITTQSNIIMKRIIGTSVGIASVILVLGAIQAQSQSVNYNFSDNTADGWAHAGFNNTTPVASVSNIGGQNYIFLPLGGFQVGNVASGYSGNLSTFDAAMFAALNNPAGYTLSYDYYINTAAIVGANFLQLGSFVNAGSGYYSQDFGATKELELNGTQLASGQVFSGHVSINMSVFGADANAATENFFRLGLIENGDGTGTGVYFSNISVTPTPEPSTLALTGLGAVATLLMFRRRLA
jgi:PEP-CTERM motif